MLDCCILETPLSNQANSFNLNHYDGAPEFTTGSLGSRVAALYLRIGPEEQERHLPGPHGSAQGMEAAQGT